MTSARLAARWESRVQRAAHPFTYPALRLAPAPLLRVPGLGVLVRDPDTVRQILVKSDAFAKNGPGTSSDLWTPVLGQKVLLNMSGVEHAEMRRKLAPLFAPSFVEALSRKSLSAPLAEFAARLRSGESIDFVQEAHRYSSIVISQLVGLPASSVHDNSLYQKIHQISGTVSLRNLSLAAEQIQAAREIMSGLSAQASQAYLAADPNTVPGRMRELGLDQDEALGAVGAFALTGTETLTSYLPRLLALLLDSGWLNRLVLDRSLTEAAISEGLRISTPVLVMLRRVRSATVINQHRFRADERVILLGFRINQAAGKFDPSKNQSSDLKQLWFGGGAHFCLGDPLAMSQIRLVLNAILDALAESGAQLRVVSRRPARNVLIPAYAKLMVSQ
ncbi:hypothetical protein RSal33209_3284 [Renibacterium salmoninarum ATCC 33209]|uniref:Cytochrome P450 n=1 Tax=Renibacterium salmoninarum (strain ATCC 33209 / DSM 20767 / JCM 11484 / NBRC 15589 / NCIMB 2235) TaxID=288705 RepID=A9WUX7_RENSM|nr:cytochrome P450 [Renibacterium salmoninarum]ABY24998.1 hypothetical protein RSal33209_3284 [Renibacterium salmoninarum ATCC 33209]